MEGEKDGEYFFLRNHSGYPQGRYDFLKDIQRLERVVADRKAKLGFAVLLTNEPNFWKPPIREWKTTKDANFRIHEDQRVTGKLTWAAQTGAGTKKDREEPIRLKDSYHLQWQDYSNWGEQALLGWLRNFSFRYLAVSVKRGP